MKSIIAFSILLFCFHSCVINPAPIDVLIPEPEQELVISSLSIPPFATAISFTKTFSAISGITDSVDLSNPNLAQKILVDSADVYIDYNGKSVKLTKLLPGVFGTIDVPLIENTTYKLKAIDFKLKKEINATTKIMPKVEMDLLEPVVIPLDDTSSTHTFKYEFTDIPNQENYYLVTRARPSVGSSLENGIEKTLTDFINPGYDLYTDKIEGDGKKISYSPEFVNYKAGDTLIVSLAHITKEYFNYLTAYKKSGNIFNSLLSEPTRTFPSNIENGFGFFSLTLPDVRTIILK